MWLLTRSRLELVPGHHFSGSTGPCRSDPRAACAGAISHITKAKTARWLLPYHQRSSSHEQPYFFDIPAERTIQHHQSITREYPGYTKPNFHFKTKEASLEAAPAGGAVAYKQSIQRAPPTGRSKRERERERLRSPAAMSGRLPSSLAA
jgi:hypothetical protein